MLVRTPTFGSSVAHARSSCWANSCDDRESSRNPVGWASFVGPTYELTESLRRYLESHQKALMAQMILDAVTWELHGDH